MNSCGQHQIGEIGFSGKLIKIDNGIIPAYSVYFGGILEAGKSTFAQNFGDIPAKNIPEFLYELAKLKNTSGYSEFSEFLHSEKENITNLIQQFEKIEMKQADSSFYSDFD